MYHYEYLRILDLTPGLGHSIESTLVVASVSACQISALSQVVCANHPRKYSEPEAVLTVSNGFRSPPTIGLVVIKTPSPTFGLPKTYPVMVPSLLKTHPVSAGVPSGGTLSGEGGGSGCGGPCKYVRMLLFVVSPPPPSNKLKRENVDRGDCCCCCCRCCGGGERVMVPCRVRFGIRSSLKFSSVSRESSGGSPLRK